MTQTKSLNVQLSNKLSAGEVGDFGEAMTAVIHGMTAELAEESRWNASLGPDEQEFHWDNSELIERYRDVARLALTIHCEEQEAVKARTLARLRELQVQARLDGMSTGEYEQIIGALESDDYSTLAW